MHHGGRPRTRPYRRDYLPDITHAVVAHCRQLTDRAVAAGIPAGRLIVDPGHDFQKTTAPSLEITRRLPELAALGYPVLVALSNKDFVGETLDTPLERRIDGSLAAAVFSVLRGAHLVRVHEVQRTVDVLRMTEAMLGWRGPAVAIRGLE
jgi:dihydropteroate synthase